MGFPGHIRPDAYIVAIAKHDFVGQSEAELSFRAGARIIVTGEREPGDWWKGEMGGKRGFFPSSFCEVYRAAKGLPTQAQALSGPEPRGLRQEERASDGRVLALERTSGICSQGPSRGRYVRALYDFTASRKNEMDLRRGAVYRVTAEQGSWLVGENETGSRRGEFPGTYVE